MRRRMRYGAGMVALAHVPLRMSVAEFLAWNPPEEGAWQLVDGVPVAMAPPNRTHGTLQGELGALIRNHLTAGGSPCNLVVTPGVVPHARAGHNVRIPDLAVTCAPYTAEEQVLTDPVLVVEILSPNNHAQTWANVWAYASIPSVHEILVLHSEAIAAELLRRNPDQTWPEEFTMLTEGTLALASIGFTAPLASLYRTTRLALKPPATGA